MQNWWDGGPIDTENYSLAAMAFRIALALIWGLAVAAVYRLSHGRLPRNGGRDQGDALPATLVLLSGLIAMVSLVIGGNVARAFSLVGALSIVRFRTVVDDTRDTAFVIFAVVVGMATGAGYIWLPAIAIPTLGGIAILLNRFGSIFGIGSGVECRLAIRSGPDFLPGLELEPILERQCSGFRLQSAETARQGNALDLTYRIRLVDCNGTLSLVNELKAIKDIQNVELKALSDRES